MDKQHLPLALMVAVLGSLAGCNFKTGQPNTSSPPVPIAAGELLSVVAYPKPIQQLNEDGFKEYRSGRIEVYDQVIVITDGDGRKTVIPHGWYRDLQFK